MNIKIYALEAGAGGQMYKLRINAFTFCDMIFYVYSVGY